jgi:hypothetical protein
MMDYFDHTKYQEEMNKFFLDSNIDKVVDASSVFRTSTETIMSEMKVYYLNEDSAECTKHNIAINGTWQGYDETLIPPYGDGQVIRFTTDNPYNLKWLWRTDGNNFVSHGKITTPSFSNKYQNSSWTQETILNNPYVIDCFDFDSSPLKDEIVYASWWTAMDLGALACTSTGEYKICLRGPAERNADFKKWLISITNFKSLILSEDTYLMISIAMSGGKAKALHNTDWVGKIKNLFKIDSTFN